MCKGFFGEYFSTWQLDAAKNPQSGRLLNCMIPDTKKELIIDCLYVSMSFLVNFLSINNCAQYFHIFNFFRSNVE